MPFVYRNPIYSHQAAPLFFRVEAPHAYTDHSTGYGGAPTDKNSSASQGIKKTNDGNRAARTSASAKKQTRAAPSPETKRQRQATRSHPIAESLMPIDIAEDEHEMVIFCEVPGVKREDIDVSIENDVVSVTALKKIPAAAPSVEPIQDTISSISTHSSSSTLSKDEVSVEDVDPEEDDEDQDKQNSDREKKGKEHDAPAGDALFEMVESAEAKSAKDSVHSAAASPTASIVSRAPSPAGSSSATGNSAQNASAAVKTTPKQRTVLVSERVFGSVTRRFKLHKSLDQDAVSTKLVDGVLELHFPKKTPQLSENEIRKISIN